MNHSKDLHLLERILKWINKMKDVFAEFNIENFDDFESNETCQLAINQLVTNIYELMKKIDVNFYNKIPLLIKLRRRLKLSRNIASHDYEQLDLDIVYKLIISLASQEIISELEAVLHEYGNH